MTADFGTAPPKHATDEISSGEYEAEVPAGPLLDLHVLKFAIWRRKRLLLALALAGMVVGASFHLVLPRKYSAVTQLYLTTPSNTDPADAMADDVSLLQTPAVAEQVSAALHLHESTSTILSAYQGSAPSDVILKITASASSQTKAVSLANAVARAFLALRSRELRIQTAALTSGLRSDVQSLQSEVNDLSDSISSLSAAGNGQSSGGSGNELTELITQRSDDQSQITQLEAQIEQDELTQTSATGASQVLDPAVPARISTKRVLATDGLSGLAAGLGVGIAGLLLSFVLSDRVRNRAQLAALIGAPVELTIDRKAQPRWDSLVRRARRHPQLLDDPGATLRMMIRRLRAQLEVASGATLAVVEVDAAKPSALALVALARSLASQGRRVTIVDMSTGRPLAVLLRVRPTAAGIHEFSFGRQPLTLIVAPPDAAETTQKFALPDDTEVVLVLASVDPAFSPDYITSLAADAVVIVDMSKAKAGRTGAVGALLRQAGITTRVVMAIGGDPQDDTVGVNLDDPGAGPGLSLGVAIRPQS